MASGKRVVWSQENKRRKLVYLIPLVAALIFQEIVLRTIFPVPEVLNFNRINYSAVRIVPGMQNGRHLSNAAFSWTSAPDSAAFIHVLNLYGFRDRDWTIEKDDNRSRIMFIGDSFVEGIMAAQDRTIPAHFERVAEDHGKDVESLNLGVAASGVRAYVDLIHDAVPLFRPDQVVVVFFANDFSGPVMDDMVSHEPLEAVFASRWQPRILYVADRIRQMQAVPRRWHTRPFPFVAAVPSESNPWSSEERARRNATFVDPTVAAAMKRGDFNPFLVDQYVRLEKRFRTEVDPGPVVQHLNGYLSRWGSQLFVVYLPHRDQASDAYLKYGRLYSSNKNPTSLRGQEYQVHARALAAACAALGVPFLDLTPSVRAAEEQGERLYWHYDPHMNERGYALVGATLFKWWEAVSR